MRQGNSQSNDLILQRLQQIRALVDESIGLLGKVGDTQKARKKATEPKLVVAHDTKVDFSIPARPFVKKHGPGLSGPKKFTLLVAWLAKGDLQKAVAAKDVRNLWNKMKGLLGFDFNTNYSTTAKDSDWVNSEKSGSYRLRPSWKGIFK